MLIQINRWSNSMSRMGVNDMPCQYQFGGKVFNWHTFSTYFVLLLFKLAYKPEDIDHSIKAKVKLCKITPMFTQICSRHVSLPVCDSSTKKSKITFCRFNPEMFRTICIKPQSQTKILSLMHLSLWQKYEHKLSFYALFAAHCLPLK